MKASDVQGVADQLEAQLRRNLDGFGERRRRLTLLRNWIVGTEVTCTVASMLFLAINAKVGGTTLPVLALVTNSIVVIAVATASKLGVLRRLAVAIQTLSGLRAIQSRLDMEGARAGGSVDEAIVMEQYGQMCQVLREANSMWNENMMARVGVEEAAESDLKGLNSPS